MGFLPGSMEPLGYKTWRLVELSDVALNPSAEVLADTISRLLLPLPSKAVIPKALRLSILVGSTHMSFAGPSVPILNVDIEEREGVWDNIGIVMYEVAVVAAGKGATVVGFSAILTVTVVVAVGMATEKAYWISPCGLAQGIARNEGGDPASGVDKLIGSNPLDMVNMETFEIL